MLKTSLDQGKLCLSCHAKSKGESTRHQPFAQGRCQLCHNAHAGDGQAMAEKEVGQICLDCHQQTAARLKEKTLHQPFAERACTACHAPHGSSVANDLLKPDPTLCLGCHQVIAKAWQDGKPHQAAVDGCANCHVGHASAGPGLLKNAVGALCLGCHPMSPDELAAKHKGIRPGADSCHRCHNPHGGAEAKLLYSKTHPPFAKGQCQTCHPAGSASPKPVGVSDSLCFGCHDRKSFQGRVVHQPVQEKPCSVCHNLHAAAHDHLLPLPAGKLCGRCHDASKQEQRFMHQPYTDGRCLNCHAAHASEAANLLPVDLASACFSCHQEQVKSYGFPHSPFKKGQCGACHLAHGSDTLQLLKAEDERLCLPCHSVDSVRGSHPFTVKIKGCLTCHDPHGGDAKSMLRKVLHAPYKQGCDRCHHGEEVVTTKVCLSCHPQVKKDYLLIHSHLTDNAAGNGCVSCHSPHAGNDRMLLAGTQARVCLRCHQDTADRHRGKASRHQKMNECLSCHTAHGGDAPAMLKGDGNTVCSGCHKSQGAFSHPVGTKTIDPRNGQMMTCVSCHDPKGTDFPYQLRLGGEKELCVQCHKY
jgi:predicted CXXCH cytochrome family protein